MSPTKKLEIIDPETLSEAHFQDLHGKRYILHTGLLKLAHEHGPVDISVDIVSYAGVGGEAVTTATVTGPRGTFTEVGDASPENTRLRTATLRLAATRAVNRACRLYLGLGMTSLEEMPPEGADAAPPPVKREYKKSTKVYGKWDGETVFDSCPDCGGRVWDNRENRRNPRAPVFKCADAEGCGWIAWPADEKKKPKSLHPSDNMTDQEVMELF
tara:strand:- start:622 stop:1263 length:642 start_codon:yes stop_codon:yes gene_type:complete